MTKLALVLLLGAAGEARLPRSLQVDPERSGASLALITRFGVPDGDLGAGDYDDVFDLGIGLGLELDYLMDADLGWSFGPYAGVDVERFDGQEETVGGARLDVDDLTILNVLFGLKGALRVDPAFLLELRLGVGFSRFFSVDAELEGGPSIDFFDASTEIAGETGLRAVFSPGPALKLEFGGGFRLRGSAEEGEGAPLNPGSMLEYVLELGIGLSF